MSYTSLIDQLDLRATSEPDAQICADFPIGASLPQWISAQTFRRDVRSMAHGLRVAIQEGDRVILMLGSTVDFAVAAFACIEAGVVFVPLPAWGGKKRSRRFIDVVMDAEAKAIICSESLASRMSLLDEMPAEFQWFTPERLVLAGREDQDSSGGFTLHRDVNRLVCLQYTSGSTGKPKGVMLTHKQLILQARDHWKYCLEGSASFCLWLPLYHDFGLNMLTTILANQQTQLTLLDPLEFVRAPVHWLKWMGQNKIEISFMPNFAAELCVAALRDDDRTGWDLQHLKRLHSGGEAIIPSSVKSFEQTFHAMGLKHDVIKPGYGMAEATLVIASTRPGVPNKVLTLDGQERISNGVPYPEIAIKIVDPERCLPLPDGEVGEIWAHSTAGHFATGYWNKPKETERVFGCKLCGENEGNWLRTGDLGCLVDGELFITGRLKDLIVINGTNVYPEDVEASVRGCYAGIQSGGVIAFPVVNGQSKEELVLAVEMRRDWLRAPRWKEASADIRKAVYDAHQLRPGMLVYLNPGGIPRTTSGKPRRHEMRIQIEKNEFNNCRYVERNGSSSEMGA